MAPKKTQKMSVGDFLNDQSLGSWADEMETQPMPSAPSSFGGERRAFSSAGAFGDRGGDRGFGASRGGFEDRPRAFREQLPLPDKPPYTAHLGNLSYEVTENDIHGFLEGCEVTSVRIVEDKLDKRPKGFGYVEFGTLDGLKKALTLSESPFQGRNIKISVAEPAKDRADARELTDWTRKGPLPDLPGQATRRPSDRAAGGFRSFEPAAEGGFEGGRRSGFPESDGKPRDFGNWERKGPLSPPPGQEPAQGGPGSRDFGSVRERKLSPAWGEGRSEGGSRPPRPERPAVERVPTAAEQDSQWRSRMKPDVPTPEAENSTPSSPAAPNKPVERPRLNLQKRTVSEAQPTDTSSASSDSKASPFGAARPIDTSAREKEIAEKRELAIRQKKEADDKAREEKKARETAAKAAAAETKEGADAQPGKQYEILRRDADGEAEGASADTPDANMNGEIVTDKDTKPREVKREVPAGGKDWRRGGAPPTAPAAMVAQESTAAQLDADGFQVVTGPSKKKGRNGGGGGGGRALAS